MKKTHLAFDQHTLCHRRMDRFTNTVFESRDAEITCGLCRLTARLPKYAAAAPITVETCDQCDTGMVTNHEFFDFPNRFDPTAAPVRWMAWTSCDLHCHETFDFRRFREQVAAAIDALTDEQYLASLMSVAA